MAEVLNLKQAPNEALEPFAIRFNEKLELHDIFDISYDHSVVNQTFKRGITAIYQQALKNVARTLEPETKIVVRI